MRTNRDIRNDYAGKPCYLNGQIAKIVGASNQFATVATLDPSGPYAEFSWKAIAHVMANCDRQFRT